MKGEEEKKKRSSKAKIVLFAAIFGAFVLDILGEGIMAIGVLFGWLIGLATMNQWQLERKENEL